MNLYFLVEGSQTERKLYPYWLEILMPEYSRVFSPEEATENNYFLISGNGYPALFDRLKVAINEINTLKKYEYLFVCLDSDELSDVEMREEVLEYLRDENLLLETANLKIIVQHRCVETWLLGNSHAYSRQPTSPDLAKYTRFYDVSKDDPESLPLFDGFRNHSQFHFDYLKKMLKEKNLNYAKERPYAIMNEPYLRAMIHRADSKLHISSFKYFLDIIRSL